MNQDTREQPLTVLDAAARLSDKRTLMDDGFWVSKREMRYLDEAIAAERAVHDRGADPLREAAQAVVDEWDARDAGDQPLGGHYLNQAEQRLRAALGEEPR